MWNAAYNYNKWYYENIWQKRTNRPSIFEFFKGLRHSPPSHIITHIRQLLHKRKKVNIWIKAVFTERQQQVIVEGEFSDLCSVDSGVPQDIVLGPFFLCHINDLPSRVKSTVRLFASLEEWASLLGMRFNVSKCYVVSIHRNHNPLTYTYTLDNHFLEKVNNNPYLGVLISDDLKWATHINKICNRATSTRGFIRRFFLKNATKKSKNLLIFH